VVAPAPSSSARENREAGRRGGSVRERLRRLAQRGVENAFLVRSTRGPTKKCLPGSKQLRTQRRPVAPGAADFLFGSPNKKRARSRPSPSPRLPVDSISSVKAEMRTNGQRKTGRREKGELGFALPPAYCRVAPSEAGAPAGIRHAVGLSRARQRRGEPPILFLTSSRLPVFQPSRPRVLERERARAAESEPVAGSGRAASGPPSLAPSGPGDHRVI
jgi:hypothetical protein